MQHTFFVHFFAAVLPGYNVKLPIQKLKLPGYSFSLWRPLAFLILLTASIKFSCYSSNEIGLLCLFVCFFFISSCSSFSFIHFNVNIKISRKKESALLLLLLFLFLLRVRIAMRFTAETRGYLKCKISLRLTWRGGCTYGRTDDFLRTKISGMHR